MNRLRIARCLAFAAAMTLPALARAVAPKVTESDSSVTVDSGQVALTFDKRTAQVTSIKSRVDGTEREIGGNPRESFYWDCNTEPLDQADKEKGQNSTNSKGYARFAPLRSFEIKRDNPDRVEIIARGGLGSWLKFDVETRVVMFDNDPGWYSYVVFTHPEDAPAARLWQTRFVTKVNPDLFDTHFAGSDRVVPRPTAEVLEKVMDATYKLADGTYDTKYNNSVYWASSLVYGMSGKNVGLWSITPSPEFFNGGPVKQGQTVHDTTLLRTLQSVHFGASPVDVSKGEPWQKVYGPFYTFINTGKNAKEMFASAQTRQQAEAAKWPYEWADHPAYIKHRGSVRGTWSLTSGKATEGAWVILAAPGGDWPQQGRSYQFFTHTGPDGVFHIPKVIPGTYSLYIFGADQPTQFERTNIIVKPDETTDLGKLDWTPISHGQTLWQIGTFDRSAGEYRNGDDARHYEVFRRYQTQFPNDVNFTIGTSDFKQDFSHAHWTWFNKHPFWNIHFTSASSPKRATLTIGFAAAQPLKGNRTNLQVLLNGIPLQTIQLPKTGTSGYRGGVQDSQYNLVVIPIDGARIKLGPNTLTLQHLDAAPFPPEGEKVDFQVGHVMYDALRFEIEP